MQIQNKIGLVLGCAISFGLSLIGNFQLQTGRTLKMSTASAASTASANSSVNNNLQAEYVLTTEELAMQRIHWLGAFLTFIGKK